MLLLELVISSYKLDTFSGVTFIRFIDDILTFSSDVTLWPHWIWLSSCEYTCLTHVSSHSGEYIYFSEVSS